MLNVRCLAFGPREWTVEVGSGFKLADVAAVLRRLVAERGSPQRTHCDNGPEFVSLQLDQWACWNRVKLDFSRLTCSPELCRRYLER
jgi:putative transposase